MFCLVDVSLRSNLALRTPLAGQALCRLALSGVGMTVCLVRRLPR
jgi:hypothetical protein